MAPLQDGNLKTSQDAVPWRANRRAWMAHGGMVDIAVF